MTDVINDIFITEIDEIDTETIPENEIHVMVGIVYNGKKHSFSVQHDNTNRDKNEFEKAIFKVAACLRLTAKKNGWVKWATN